MKVFASVLLCFGLAQAGFAKSNFAYDTIEAVQPIFQPVAQAITYSPYPFHLIQPQYYQPLITSPTYFGQFNPVFGPPPPVQQHPVFAPPPAFQPPPQVQQPQPQAPATKPETVSVENDSITVEAA